MSSHNSAISSRINLNPVVSSQSLYIATFVGRLCCTRLLIHNNANLTNPYTIVLVKSEVRSFSESLIIFAIYINGFTCRLLAAFPCSLQRCYIICLFFLIFFAWCA